MKLPEPYPRGSSFNCVTPSLDRFAPRPKSYGCGTSRAGQRLVPVWVEGLMFTRLELQDVLTLQLFIARLHGS